MSGFTVRFHPDGKTTEVEEGTLISEAAKQAGVPIRLPCGGRGRCGKCGVRIAPESDVPFDGCGMDRVLACQTPVSYDAVIQVIRKESDSTIAASDRRRVDAEDLTPLSGGLGLAVDIGTTTVGVSVLDLDKGVELYTAVGENMQRIRGEDVLSRIQYSEDNGTGELRDLLLGTINGLLEWFEAPAEIDSVCISGNTVMTYLFLGRDPAPLRLPPYVPEFRESEIKGSESGIRGVSADARVVCMPCSASYVGGDIASDIVFSGMDRSEDLCLLMDVGTNGEVALGNAEMMLVCSSSAGPAFEGGNIASGMMANPGAIDSVRIEDGRITYTVIGGSKPEGICGSGIVDLVAQLFLAGMIDKKGNMTGEAPYTEEDGERLLTVADGINISESEIKHIIMTKAAIYSAARSMAKGLGTEFSDLDRIYIAGGFGKFIDTDSAIAIGLFPDVDRDRYQYLGNASLGGARQYLVSEGFRTRTTEAFRRMTYRDLGSDPVFFDEYSSAQFLPHTDSQQFPSLFGPGKRV
ncbi:MAG: ASKHA domain-containing protein [Candidatus Methanomethylophilaceae archaeon]|jgi:uncharacterized 2Fe-2S/4Fe-4S cluster protein (DUF4445 family)|nr:ASKHA domain-containing protein [Candidatus Methanomethylophilaceae archaeon]NLF33488.1 DUF4445 domain-containing protein [Thermoplasmatales archaeon]